jgi:hypothetical protein
MKKTATILSLLSLLACSPAFGKKMKLTTEPDYTKGESLEDKGNDWALGPTGAFGNIWALSVGDTEKTRTIQIRDVTQGTPAAGVLEKGDVILGVISPVAGGKQKPDARFDSDARKALSAAITEAEKKENGGKLVLNIWRQGKTQPATLTLKVMGTFSNSTPWECEKTTALIEAASQSILKRGLFSKTKSGEENHRGIDGCLDALGLLATGEAKYLPEIQKFARAVGDPKQKYDLFGQGLSAWSGSYSNLFLTEYYLATKDDYVLPAIKELSQTIAMGRSGVGTWSHGMSIPAHNGGELYGMAASYGAMNQCSLTCTISLVIAQKCGIDSPEITEAVRMYTSFCRWWADKGTIPYGDHAPMLVHDGNGKNSQAAVLFDLVGDKETANYFTRMTLSSYNVREGGHTGHYFASQWGALGAARGGDQAAQSFVRKMRWFTEMERRADGGLVYQEQLANTPGKYPDWSTTGQRLMQHCLPRKKLHITGKGGSSIAPITGSELENVVAAGVFDPTGLTAKQLLEKLGSWSPVVRYEAGKALGQRDENVVKELISMLKSPNHYARYGACEGLRYAGRGSEEAIMALLDIIKDADDLTLRYYAVVGLRKSRQPSGKSDAEAMAAYEKSIGSSAAMDKAIPVLLKLATTYEPKLDPGRKLQSEIAEALFTNSQLSNYTGYMPGGKGVEKLDTEYLIPAIKSMLTNPNGRARSMVSGCYAYLSPEQLKALWGDIYYATKYQAPSGEMFATGVRSNGMNLMAKHSVKEGIPVGVDYALRQEGWGNGSRKYGGIPPLLTYGKSLENYIPEINSILEKWQGRKSGSWNDQSGAEDFKKKLDEALKKPAPNLISIKPYIDATPDPVASAGKKKK